MPKENMLDFDTIIDGDMNEHVSSERVWKSMKECMEGMDITKRMRLKKNLDFASFFKSCRTR